MGEAPRLPWKNDTGSGGFSLGRLDGRVITSDHESHVAVVAPTRAGKTTRCVIPWILEHTGPIVATSTKTDLVEATLHARTKLGRVYVYDPFDPRSARWSPIPGCTNWSGALRQASWFADCAKVGDSEEAEFWGAEAAKLMAPLFHAAALEDCNIATVLGWINTRARTEPDEILARHHAAKARDQLTSVTSLDARNAGNVYLTAGSLLHAYRYPEIHVAEGPILAPDDFLDGGANTLYVVAADHDQRMLAPLIVALIGSILHVAATRAREDRPLRPTLRVLLDEVANIAPLRDLPRQLSQAAGHGVRVATIWQSLGQLNAHYGPNADAILANSTAKLFMGPVTDRATLDYVTQVLGDEQVDERSTTADAHTHQPASRTTSRRSKPKAGASALQQLGDGRVLLLHANDPPAIVRLRRE